jgi:dimethylhistidine N-methyltransferase
MALYRVLDSIKHKDKDKLREQFALDVLTGFSAEKKYLPSLYFYDEEGSRLFSEIMNQPEYYPTQCEFEILRTHSKKISELIGDVPFNLMELGAGDGRKTQLLLEQLLSEKKNFSYIPVDISEDAVAQMTDRLHQELKNLKIEGVVGEYMDSVDLVQQRSSEKNVILFLGGNIGNFTPSYAMVFLRTLWRHLDSGDLLYIGFDLKKDVFVMNKAYNDRAGVTAAFNLNVLQRINNELGANFDLSKFKHYGSYNPVIGAMESFLISLEDQEVYVKELEKNFSFYGYEAIHLEYSHKYLPKRIHELAAEAGYEVIAKLTDEREFFMGSVWKVIKD